MEKMHFYYVLNYCIDRMFWPLYIWLHLWIVLFWGTFMLLKAN